MMKSIFVGLILVIISGELFVHFLAKPEIKNHCMQIEKSILSETKSEVCTCYTDKMASEGFLLLKDSILNNKDKITDNLSLYFEQCKVLQDDKAKEKIAKSLKKNISNNLTPRLTSTDQQLLEDLYLNEYTINVRPGKKYRYSVEVEVTAKVRVFLGVVEYQTYLGTLYYDGQAEFNASLSKWERSKKQVDPSGLIDGIEKVHQFFNDN